MFEISHDIIAEEQSHICNAAANINYNCDQLSHYMSTKDLNNLKYNLSMLSLLELYGRCIVKIVDNLKLLLNSITNKFNFI